MRELRVPFRTPLSLSHLNNLERFEKIPGAPTRRWGEWIWLTGPSGLDWNSPQGLNISSIRVFDQIRDPEIPINLRPHDIYISPSSVFCPRSGPSLQTQTPRLQFCPKAGLPLQTREPRLQFYQGLNRCGSFPLLSTPHFLFSIWTDLKRSENIPVAPTWRWREWI